MASELIAVVKSKPANSGLMSMFHRIWPALVLAAGLIVTVAWMGLLGYGLVKLI